MTKRKVILSGDIRVPVDELHAILEALPHHVELSRAEPGNLVFEVTQDTSDPSRMHVYEEFVDQAAFDSHQERTRKSAWGRLTQNAVRHYTIRRGGD